MSSPMSSPTVTPISTSTMDPNEYIISSGFIPPGSPLESSVGVIQGTDTEYDDLYQNVYGGLIRWLPENFDISDQTYLGIRCVEYPTQLPITSSLNSVAPTTTEAVSSNQTEDGRNSSPTNSERFPSPKASKKRKRLFSCVACTMSFTNLKLYGDHMVQIHNIRAFKCDYCETRVSRHDNLKSHKKHCKNRLLARRRPKPTPLDTCEVRVNPTPHNKCEQVNIFNPPKATSISSPATNGCKGKIPKVPRVNLRPDRSSVSPQASVSSVDSDSLVVEPQITEVEALWKSLQLLRAELKEAREEANIWKRAYFKRNQHLSCCDCLDCNNPAAS